MTPQDRIVLSGLLERAKMLDNHKTHDRFIYFIRKCIEEATKRGAKSFAQRFTDMYGSHQLSFRAFDSRRQLGARLAATGHAVVSWLFPRAVA